MERPGAAERAAHAQAAQPRGLERVTLNLTPKAVAALEGLVNKTGSNKTDVVNTALLVTEFVTSLEPGTRIVVPLPDGGEEFIRII